MMQTELVSQLVEFAPTWKRRHRVFMVSLAFRIYPVFLLKLGTSSKAVFPAVYVAKLRGSGKPEPLFYLDLYR